MLVPAAGSTAAATVTKSLAFQGAYAATTNYGLNDVVTWLNTAWISIGGVEPRQHAGPEPLRVGGAGTGRGATGAQGVAGTTGAAGVQGPQGERGYTGLTGDKGDRGAAGPTGRAGLVYQGPYASTTNYTTGDVVVWQGSSYASLMDSNHGNTPSESPTDWGLLTSTGPRGDTGATGAQGLQGIQGVAGEFGPAGQQGPTGPAGSTGPQGQPGRDGTQGPEGERGPVGFTGAPGPVGLTYRGAYASGTNYAQERRGNVAGRDLAVAGEQQRGTDAGREPRLLDAAGGGGALPGHRVCRGVTGPQGPQGATGAIGSAGACGCNRRHGRDRRTGFHFFRGPYSSVVNYALHDAVSYGGGTWLSLRPGNHGNTPGTTADWGADGGGRERLGPTGATVAPGAAGTAGKRRSTGHCGYAGPGGGHRRAGPAGGVPRGCGTVPPRM